MLIQQGTQQNLSYTKIKLATVKSTGIVAKINDVLMEAGTSVGALLLPELPIVKTP